MRGTGSRALMFLSILALVMTGAIIGARADVLNVAPANNLIINHPSFPLAGGPYIVGATYDATNTRIVLVFNEGVEAVESDIADFYSETMDLSGAALGDDDADNVLFITGMADFTDNGTETIRLSGIGVIRGSLDGFWSKDVSTITVGRGPIPIGITLNNFTDDANLNNQTITVDWDAPAALVGTANQAFGGTPELNGATLAIAGNTTATWTISRTGGTDLLKMTGGLSKLWIASGQVRYQSNSVATTQERKMAIGNLGPYLLAAYYFDNNTANVTDDAIWAVFNEPVDPSSIDGAFVGGGNFAPIDGGGTAWAPAGGSAELAFPGFTTATVLIRGFDEPEGDIPDDPADALRHLGGNPLRDYLGASYLTDVDQSVHVGPGILRASYDDGQTVETSNDKLIIWLSEPIDNPGDVTASDFATDGEWAFGANTTVLVEANVAGLGKVTFTNFAGVAAGQLPRPGVRIAAADDGTPIIGDVTGDEINVDRYIPVVDESRPSSVQLATVSQRDSWDDSGATDVDSLFFSWSESVTDDGDEYFLFITETLPGDITNEWMNANLARAIPLGNIRPNQLDAVAQAGIVVQPDETQPLVPGAITTYTDDSDPANLETGDQAYVLLAAADFTGNTQYRVQNQGTVALLFSQPFWVGPICSLQDWYVALGDESNWDTDIIHVRGDSTLVGHDYFVFGDARAVPCPADSVIVYNENGDRIGVGPVESDGSFDPIQFEVDPDDMCFIYLAAKLADDETPEADRLAIRVDLYYPRVDAKQIFDPWNPYQVYNAGDYVNIRLLLDDRVCEGQDPLPDAIAGRNDVADVWGDFSRIDSTGIIPAGFSEDPSHITFYGLGRDRKDNDGDWWANWLPGDDDDPVDVGIDGIPGTNDFGEDDDKPTAGDPYVDENGNGVYDLGETFLDVVNQAGQSGVYDAGEPNLDSLDPDEHGWYEVRANTRALWGTVKQGFPLVDGRVREEARLDPFTLVTIHLRDNGIDNDLLTDTSGKDLSLNQTYVLDGSLPDQRFLATIDFQEPTVSEFSGIFNETGITSNVGGNLLLPGNPVYHLGQYLDVTIDTPSDADVLFNQLQLKKSTTWQTLSLDPAGDANADGFPGGEAYSEDFRETSEQLNVDNEYIGYPGVDDDEDGTVDEPGEGVDFSDAEVHDASETAAQDAANTYGDGISCENDGIDNDNDAFFVYDPFETGDPVDPTVTYGRMIWWNIDENRTNGLDDDGDGQIDEADELPEADAGNANRYIAANDDDEDGIRDGEAVRADGPLSFRGNGVPGPFFVSAATVMGARTSANGAAADSLAKFYANGLSYGDGVGVAYPVMTASSRRLATSGYDTDLPLGSRTDWQAATSFNYRALQGENIDLERIAAIYDLAGDGVTEYQLRGLAYDRPGNMNERWSEPITFTFDLEDPIADLDGCDDDPLNAGSDFADVDPNTGDVTEIFDAGKHPDTYTLVLDEVSDDVVKVRFDERRRMPDGTWGPWVEVGTDNNLPFVMEWPNTGSMYTVNNYPADRSQDVQFRAIATDLFNNETPEESACILDVTVIDGTEPSTWVQGIYTTFTPDYWMNLNEVVEVPADSSINVWIQIEDNDKDGLDVLTTLMPEMSVGNADPFTTMWSCGIDFKTGDAGEDDDNDGSIDEDDVDGDGIFTWGVDDAGADNKPGTADDEWNGSSANPNGNNAGLSDDYITNDIMYVVFQYRQVNPAGDWTTFETVHGDEGAGGAVMDFTLPVKATLDTKTIAATLGEGLYEIRAYACDIEGNCNVDKAPIGTISIRSNALRAYIQPELCPAVNEVGDPIEGMIGLFAVHHIHDYEIDKVRFEYWYDSNGDGCADAGDVGSNWMSIDVDDVNDAANLWGARGDALLYRNNTDSGSRDKLQNLVWRPFDYEDHDYMYWDADNDGIYSPRDAVVDDDGDGLFSYATDDVAIGGYQPIVNGVTLSNFDTDEFWAEDPNDDESGYLEPSDYIFRENELTGDNNALELWYVVWDPTGLVDASNYLVRAIATDENNNEDTIDQTCYDPDLYNPLELEKVTLDLTPPTADIVSVMAYYEGATPGTVASEEVLGLAPPFVPGKSKYVKITAETSDPNILKMLFEYSLDGGVNYTALDVNNDLDYYVSLDGNPGYQKDAGILSSADDEIFFDQNGDLMYDAGDYVLYAGRNGVVDTPVGTMLLPLVSEDPDNSPDPPADDDGDGYIDEDRADGPASPEDYAAPFTIWWDLTTIDFAGDINVILMATPTEDACPGGEREGAPDMVSVIFGENIEPLADVIRVETEDDEVIDVWHTVADGDGYDVFGADVEILRVFVTAEDPSGVVDVRLYYRSDPECGNPGAPTEWTYVEAAGIDAEYPYQFNWPMAGLPDGAYQFYAEAVDDNGNKSVIPVFPYGFRKFSNFGADFAQVRDLTDDSAAPGDEYEVFADLSDPAFEPIVGVDFYYAPRILNESVDAGAITPIAPFRSEPLSKTVVMDGEPGNGVILTIDGVVQTYEVDYTIDGSNRIEFAVKPSADAAIEISYNFAGYQTLNKGDEYAPYSVEWSAVDGGVPDPANMGWAGADAYDLIAVARFDIDGDGVRGSGNCDFTEPFAFEGTILLLEDQERPGVVLYGLTRDTDYAYPDFNRPGNPLFISIAGNQENKLSGIETDLFAVAEDVGGGSIAEVWAEITADVPGKDALVVPFTEYNYMGEGQSFIALPITFYASDFPEYLPEDIENVSIKIDSSDEYPMTEIEPGIWQATLNFAYGTSDAQYEYKFRIDLIGDTQSPKVVDPRNNSGNIVPTTESLIVIPGAPFWYAHLDNEADLTANMVHRTLVYAKDDSDNVGNNLNSDVPAGELGSGNPQGPIMFIYDPTAPVVQAITVMHDPASWSNGTDVIVTANDNPFTDLNVITISGVLLQYSPNNGQIWLDAWWDTDPSDGWIFDSWSPNEPPEADGYDNDGDGLWDEEDENVATYLLRAVAADDGHNYGYADFTVSVKIDNSQPSASITTPINGTLFHYGDLIHIEATAVGDAYPKYPHPDVHHVLFQYKDGRHAWIDEAGNANSHAGRYDAGVDEVFVDENGNGFYNAGESQLYPGANGVWNAPDGATAMVWFDMDVTPQDNGDDPWDYDLDGDGVFEIDFASDQFWGDYDTYVHFRAVATDLAQNTDDDADGYGPPETLVILDDNSAPAAYITEVMDKIVDPIEKVGVQGTIDIEGSFSPVDRAAYVSVYGQAEGQDPFLIGVDNYLGQGTFVVSWVTDHVAEGDYTLWALVTDDDGNESPAASALKVMVDVDRTGPSVNYEAILPNFAGFVATAPYENDGIPAHSSPAVVPDPNTNDVLLAVTTPDADVVSIYLQWAKATDPDGFWRPASELIGGLAPGGMMDYEPNLDFAVGDVTHHVWRYNIENAADVVMYNGVIRARALATDEAGNTNALQLGWPVVTIDGDDPFLYDWNDTAVNNQIEVGTSVTFSITAQDATTDVESMRLELSTSDNVNGDWIPVTGDIDPDALQIDTPNAMWHSEFVWTAPDFVIHDTEFSFRVRTIDTAGNVAYLYWPDGPLVVEDNAPPDRSKVVDVQAQVIYTDDSYDGEDLPAGGYDPTCFACNDNCFIDLNGNGDYDPGVDFVISEGASPGIEIPDGLQGGGEIVAYGAVTNTYPRDVDESFLNDPNPRRTLKINNAVTVVGRTQGGDDGIGGNDDQGVAFVEFWATPTDANGNAIGDAQLIGKDEHAPNFPYYLWHVGWDVYALDQLAQRVWPDGYYQLWVKAVDQEGNVEIAPFDATGALVLIDTVAPTATMDADPQTTTVETTATVQRNSAFTLFARTDTAVEDDVVTFMFKRSRDLNTGASYGVIQNDWGVTPEDGNPDETRPFSFDLDLGQVADPTDPDGTTPLHVGEAYDFVVQVDDEVGNTTTQIENRDANRHIVLNVIDTIAPHMTIVEARRAAGDTDPIVNPTVFHASAMSYLVARDLQGHLDLSSVEFVYREMGTSNTPTLIDADLTQDPNDPFTWTLGAWDLAALKDQTWYEVAAIGVDDVGNVESFDAAAKIQILVDRTAAPFALMHPAGTTSKWCDYGYNEDTGHRVLDLIAQVTSRGTTFANGDVQHDDVLDVVWEWKWSYEDPTAWRACGVTAGPELYDDALNTYSNTLVLDLLEFDEEGCKPDTDFDAVGELVDFRVWLYDVAGNANVIEVDMNTIDTVPPAQVGITNIKLAVDDPTQDPIDFGQVTEVTRGLEVEIWGTASDDEPNIPNLPIGHETMITQLQFQVAEDLNHDNAADGGIWRDLGTIVFDPADLGDPSAVTGSVLWNTTGLVVDGEYLLRVIATDECQNTTISGTTDVIIRDNIPPTARIVAFDPDQDPHGEDPLTYLKIYALAESDPDIVDVLFQYDTIEGPNDTDHEWVNIGFGRPVTGQHDYTTEVLWCTTVESTAFPQGQTHFWIRALAKDSDGNRYGDKPEDIVPTMEVNLVTLLDGSKTFEPVRTAVQGVEKISVQIENFDQNLPQAILTVDMPNSQDRPRVVVLGESNNFVAPNDYQWIYSAGVPSDPENGQFGLVRSLDDPTVWRGKISLTTTFGRDSGGGSSISECLKYSIFVTGLDANWFIDEVTTAINEFPVTTELGTNGTVVTPGYDDLFCKVTVQSGAWQFADACLLVSQTVPPTLWPEETVYIEPVADTAYHIEMTKVSDGGGMFRDGYNATVTIKYTQEAVDAAIAGSQGVTEEMLTIRVWDSGGTNDPNSLLPEYGDSYWDAEGIRNIRVNTAANEITFNVDNLLNASESDGNVFQVFAPKSGAPVFLYNVTPHSAYLSNWMTDADPIFNFYLHDVGGQGIEAHTIKVKVDGRDVATFFDVSPFTDDDDATWCWGAGSAHISAANDEGNDGHATIYELDYWHSPLQRDWLTEGEHTITVEYRTHGTDELTSVTTPFSVDLTAPIVEFHGGWVSDPVLRNIHGYIAGDDAMLTVRMYDPLSGIFVRPERQEFLQDPDCDGLVDDNELYFEPFTGPGEGGILDDIIDFDCFNPIDWGIHYDLWRVDGEDEQLDIDEFEERELLHQGTADEILPYLEPPLYGTGNVYDPSEELMVKLPIMGGGRIQDGDILEVTIYSQKTRTLLGEGPALQCDVVDTLMVGGETLYVLDGCWFDFLSQQRIIYQQGVLDQVRNSGSKYVEQRFIVDEKAPACAINSPSAVLDPNSPMVIDVTAADTGVGVGSNPGDLVVVITGPDGVELVPEDAVWNNGHYTATIPAPLPVGDYTITMTAKDRLGHVCSTTKTVRVEATMLTLTDVYSYPNPFDPADGDAFIHFALSKTSDVTIKVYDFAGNFVTTIANHEQITPSKMGGVYWGGTASDGTKLANGAYIVRVTATDGARTEEANLKVVLWRE